MITGSTSGIGRGTANPFAAEGARVAVNGRRRDWGEKVVEEIKRSGGEAAYYQADVSQSQQVRDLVKFAIDTYGRLDILMNNAFANQLGSVVELAEEDWGGSIRKPKTTSVTTLATSGKPSPRAFAASTLWRKGW